MKTLTGIIFQQQSAKDKNIKLADKEENKDYRFHSKKTHNYFKPNKIRCGKIKCFVSKEIIYVIVYFH